MSEQLKMSSRKKQEILDTLKKDLNADHWQLVKDVLEDSIRMGIVIIDDHDPES